MSEPNQARKKNTSLPKGQPHTVADISDDGAPIRHKSAISKKNPKKSLPEQLIQVLEHEILTGKYAVGDKIPTEPELVQLFGISRNSVREAVQALIYAGLLESRQGSGTYVVAMSRLQVEVLKLGLANSFEEIAEFKNLLLKYFVKKITERSSIFEMKELEFKLNRLKAYASEMADVSLFDSAMSKKDQKRMSKFLKLKTPHDAILEESLPDEEEDFDNSTTNKNEIEEGIEQDSHNDKPESSDSEFATDEDQNQNFGQVRSVVDGLHALYTASYALENLNGNISGAMSGNTCKEAGSTCASQEIKAVLLSLEFDFLKSVASMVRNNVMLELFIVLQKGQSIVKKRDAFEMFCKRVPLYDKLLVVLKGHDRKKIKKILDAIFNS